MQRAAGFYKRRLPWVGMPPARIAAVPPRMVLRPLVVHPGKYSRGGQLKRFAPPGSVGVIQQRPPHMMLVEITRRPPPGQGRVYMTRVMGLPTPPPPPPLAVVRGISLRARPDNHVALRASVATAVSLKANVQTSWALKASAVMSISAKLTFFQGEDITLTFSLTPPVDITGWTLTCTVKNQLGGTTQFTVTPTILDTGRGVFQVVWGRSNTSTLTPGDYVWDVRRTDTGNNTVLAHGEATVKQPVTA